MQKAIDNFKFHCEFEKGLSHYTLKAYSIDLEQFKSFIIQKYGNLLISQINKSHLKSYIQIISNNKTKTIKRKLATLKAMFNFLEFEDELEINPFRKIKVSLKEELKLPVVLNLNEVGAILKLAYTNLRKITRVNTFLYRQTDIYDKSKLFY